MDPLEALRGDIPVLDPLERARLAGSREDVREERQRQERLAERRDAAESAMVARAAMDRQQLAARGYTDAQLQAHNAEVEAVRAGRVAELEAELDRLDPARARAKAQRAAEAQAAATLARAKAAGQDELMRVEVARYDARRAAEGDELRRRRQDELSRLAADGWVSPDHPEIIR